MKRDAVSALEGSKELWDALAEVDPLWAILSDTAKKGGRWDVKRFFQTGIGEISLLFYELQLRGIEVNRGSALDFGCGVGRLTQALASHFDRAVGVDVSPKMIELATAINRFPQRISYLANDRPDLSAFGDAAFTFIVSNIVLQHIPSEITLGYLREFHRVLAPAGILVFQLPSAKRQADDPPPAPSMRPMPDDAYRASLGVAGIPGGPVGPASELTLEVDVTNASAFRWSQHEFGLVSAGNHWLDDSGARMIRRDDGRAGLPQTLDPGEVCRLSLTITSPLEAGAYQCEIDLAHEGVVWFGEKGSPLVRFPVRVERQEDAGSGLASKTPTSHARTLDQPAEPDDLPTEMPALGIASRRVEDPGDFPMYGVQKETVLALIVGMGLEVIHVENDRSCGDDWVSYRYFVRKP